MSKYNNVLLDGRWKFVDAKKSRKSGALFENIYNHQTIVLYYSEIKDILDSKTTVSKIMAMRINSYDLYRKFKHKQLVKRKNGETTRIEDN